LRKKNSRGRESEKREIEIGIQKLNYVLEEREMK
jgi:hypothetical protein